VLATGYGLECRRRIAHDVWVGASGVVYEKFWPGGSVRRNLLSNVSRGKTGDPYRGANGPVGIRSKGSSCRVACRNPVGCLLQLSGFLPSEVATGKPQSFQRDAVLVHVGDICRLSLMEQPTSTAEETAHAPGELTHLSSVQVRPPEVRPCSLALRSSRVSDSRIMLSFAWLYRLNTPASPWRNIWLTKMIGPLRPR